MSLVFDFHTLSVILIIVVNNKNQKLDLWVKSWQETIYKFGMTRPLPLPNYFVNKCFAQVKQAEKIVNPKKMFKEP